MRHTCNNHQCYNKEEKKKTSVYIVQFYSIFHALYITNLSYAQLYDIKKAILIEMLNGSCRKSTIYDRIGSCACAYCAHVLFIVDNKFLNIELCFTI